MANTNKGGKYAAKAKTTISMLGLVLCLIFGFTLLCNLVIIVKGSLYPEKPPSVFGTTPMVVLSGSMSGTAEDHIEVGDLIFVGKTTPEKLEVGDVIAFMEGEIVVTHRIVGIENGDDGLQFRTKGDANNTEDRNLVSADNLVGIYTGRIPKVGDFAIFLQTPMGMLLFIGVPVLGFTVYDMIRRQRYANREKKKNDELQAELRRLRRMAGEE